jgi:hypothetical protein
MTPSEIEAVLQVAFTQCDAAFCALTEQQKKIILQVVAQECIRIQSGNSESASGEADLTNPLDSLHPEQREALLQFIKEQQQENRPWKIQLLNDWLHDRDSGSVQFIRDRYGPQWLNRIQQIHLAHYFEQDIDERLKLKIGDRIEVSNRLWEWVQETGACSPEWFLCTVIGLSEATHNEHTATNCLIRFDSGMEYEIQGIYEWNSYYWRWPLA